MTATAQTLPVRIYEAGVKIMVAAPMPGLEPGDIAVAIDGNRVKIRGAQRGPRQNAIRLAAAEWRIGPYERDLRLSAPVSGELANATFGNGVLVLALPKAAPGASPVAIELTLETIEPTRGQRVGHLGRVPRPPAPAAPGGPATPPRPRPG